MLEILGQSTETCLVVRFTGKVTIEEYQQFLEEINERLKESEKVNLVLALPGFEFYDDFATARKDFQFAFAEYKQVRRTALVGDQKWIDWFTHLIGLFTRAEEKHFPEDQFEEACSWACA